MKRIQLIAVSLILFFNLTCCSGGLSAEFKDDYALFVRSADRMVGLAVDDISYPEFLIQLEEVQNYYIKLDAHKWSDQLSTAHASFESAIHSLNLVKGVWEVYNKGSGSWRCSLDRDVGNAVAMTLEISERMDDTDESALKWLRSQTCDLIINDLLENFSLHYKVGKNEIKKFIEIPD
jgi:hypothetical protein